MISRATGRDRAPITSGAALVGIDSRRVFAFTTRPAQCLATSVTDIRSPRFTALSMATLSACSFVRRARSASKTITFPSSSFDPVSRAIIQRMTATVS